MDSIDYLDDNGKNVLEKSWEQAYRLYQLDAKSGELGKEELLELMHRSDNFITKSTEAE